MLDRLGYSNTIIKVGDGTIGWKEQSPFDAIIVSAATPEVPQNLIGQLREGGVCVLPLGEEPSQQLCRICRIKEGSKKERLGPCRFVKLIEGRHMKSPERNTIPGKY